MAIGRTLFRKGATLGNAIIFTFASTNLVVELSLALLLLLGWHFLAAEFVGGVLMIAVLFVAFRLTLTSGLRQAAREAAQAGRHGRMEGHAAMDMGVHHGTPILQRLLSLRGFTAVAHVFWMNVASLWSDLLLGFAIAGAVAAWVPAQFWNSLFLSGNGTDPLIWGACIGPLVAMLAFVCSVGNVPLAAVLWRGGLAFGGVVAFLFGDLLILPILNIYCKYFLAAG